MKIVYCIAATYNSGGMERVLANKANFLADNGHQIHIVTTDQRERKPFFHMSPRIECHDLDINYEENNGKSIFSKIFKYPFKQFKHRKALDECLKKIKADIVISMFCNDVNIVPKIKDGSKKVLEVHFSRYKRLQYGRKGLWRLIDRIRYYNDRSTAGKYDRFIVLTNEDRSYWGNMTNIQVIPNAHTFKSDSPAELTGKKVLAIGRYNYQKGFDRLIEAWKYVDAKHKDWILEIIGDGELREELEQQIQRLGLTHSIQLQNATSDITDKYENASIFALSSRYEGLPMVLLEAQAYGLPIVSFNCKCGPKDIIEDGISGFIVEDGQVKEFADRINQLIENAAKRKEMGKAAYRNSLNYSTSAIMQKWDNLFMALTEGENNGRIQ